MPVPLAPAPAMRAATVDGSWLQEVWAVKVDVAGKEAEVDDCSSSSFTSSNDDGGSLPQHEVGPPQPPRSRLDAVCAVLYDYTYTSTLHGVGLLGNRALSKHERYMWAAAVVVSAVLLAIACGRQLQEFADAPAITRLEQNNLPTFSIPFPAVTICNPSYLKPSLIANAINRYMNRMISLQTPKFVDTLKGMNGTGDAHSWPTPWLGIVETLSFYHYPRFNLMKKGLSLIGDLLEYLDGMNIAQVMLQTRLGCQDLLARCYWKGIAFACCEQFQLQLTEMGYCLSFNSRTSTGPRILCAEKNCHHVWSSGPGTGLVIVFKDLSSRVKSAASKAYVRQMIKTVQFWNQFRTGTPDASNPNEVWDSEEMFSWIHTLLERDFVQVMIHDRKRFPLVDDAFPFSTELKNDYSVSVSMSITSASDTLKSLRIQERNCLFGDEAKLLTAKTYSQSECISECRMQSIVDTCGCRPYYTEIRSPLSARFPECRFTQLSCLSGLNLHALNCSHCLIECKFTKYDFRVTPSISINNGDSRIGTSIDISYDRYRAAVLYRQQLSHTVVDVWVSIGSLACLFLGCSFLSILDILHLLLRVARVALGSDFKPIATDCH